MKELPGNTSRDLTVGKSAYDENGFGLLIDPEPVLLPYSIVCHFPEVLLVIEGDAAAGAVTASVDLVALHLVDVAVLVDSASHH